MRNKLSKLNNQNDRTLKPYSEQAEGLEVECLAQGHAILRIEPGPNGFSANTQPIDRVCFDQIRPWYATCWFLSIHMATGCIGQFQQGCYIIS